MLNVVAADAGQRLDHYLTRHCPEHSRSSLNKLIASAHVLVDGQPVKAGYRLRPGETVTVTFPVPPPADLVPEQIDFTVLYEDEHLLVIGKPPGLVVHPACGHSGGTLVHGLLYRCKDLPVADAGRPGIVHRLDKDTSGVMLVAKTERALRALMSDFKDRRMQKVYHALLVRSPREPEGRVVAPIGRHPVDRKKMAIHPAQGRYAATWWRISEVFANGWCLAEIGIETGRTHQIRVHMASLKAPVAGDSLYGGGVDRNGLVQPLRQMLHASTICFQHPVSGEELCFTAPLWDDFRDMLAVLREITP
jgi:23S rRNA pseudouridine1911/1915/1917 synthase